MKIHRSMPALIAAAVCASSALAQEEADFRLEATQAELSIVVDGERLGRWAFNPNNYPRNLVLPVTRDAPSDICLVSGERRACASFTPGQSRTLEILFDGGVYRTVIEAQFERPPAVFDESYQAAHRGKVVVEAPEVYELVNIAIAMTPYARSDDDLVYRDGDYYQAVQTHFAAYANHPVLQRIDAMLRESRNSYFPFKMNAYAFVFDDAGRLVQSPIYDRTGFAGSLDNPTRAYLADLQDFADVSGFREFYRDHAETYAEQVRFFETEADVNAMNRWLTEQFPSVTPYDGVKIIFSPLVAYNQSLTTIEADGYRELQPHVNYPYETDRRLSAAGAAIQRGAILFTEMNHGFADPTAAPFRDRLAAALSNRARWADDSRAAGNYTGAQQVFNEYMNWALVILYDLDHMTPEDFAIARAGVVANMERGRGFPRFGDFSAELLRRYQARGPGETVETLYPELVAWFEAEAARTGQAEGAGRP